MITTTQSRSFCRLCPAYCGILVTHDGDRVVKVQGDRDHPVSQGYTCPKGRALGELHHHPQRLDGPLLRRNGRLEPVTWDELLDDLAAKLRPLLDGHGPAAVGAYFGTAAVFDANLYWAGARFLRQLGSPSKFTSGTIDAPSYPVVRRLMAGVGWIFHSIDFERTTLLLLLGTNPVVSHNSHMQAFPNPTARIREIERRGEVWVVDARRTETARLATRHLAPRPGSDYALLAFLVRELLREGADAEYLAAHATRVDELRAAVEPFDEAAATRLTGPRARRPVGPARRRAPARSALAADGHGHLDVGGREPDAVALGRTARRDRIARAAGRRLVQPRLRAGARPAAGDAGPGARAGAGEPPRAPRQGGEYPSITMLDEMEAGNIRAMLVLGGNLVAALPDASRVKAALRQTPVVVVSDVQHGDMTELATHVFAATGPLERADLPHFSDCLAPTLAAQYTPAVVPVGADRRPAWWPPPPSPSASAHRSCRRASRSTRPPTTTSCACACGPRHGRRSTSSRPPRPRSWTTTAPSAGWSATSCPTGAGIWRPRPCSPSSSTWRSRHRSC